MITCNVCGHLNDSSDAICENCGSDLSDSPDWGVDYDEEDDLNFDDNDSQDSDEYTQDDYSEETDYDDDLNFDDSEDMGYYDDDYYD